jgi:hypothetical protein
VIGNVCREIRREAEVAKYERSTCLARMGRTREIVWRIWKTLLELGPLREVIVARVVAGR